MPIGNRFGRRSAGEAMTSLLGSFWNLPGRATYGISGMTVPRHLPVRCELMWIAVESRESAVIQRALSGLHVETVLLRQGLELRLGPGAEMLDDLGRGERAEPRRGAVVGPARKSDQETGGEQVAGAGGVD